MKTAEEIRGQNAKSTLNERRKENCLVHFFKRMSVPESRSPLDGFSRLKKAFINKGLDIRFGELTRQPPICWKYALEAIIEMIIFPCIHD